MKNIIIYILLGLLLGVSILLWNSKDSALGSKDFEQGNQNEVLINKESDDVSMLEMLGYNIVLNTGLKDLGFVAEDTDAIARGIKKALSQDQLDEETQSKMEEFQLFIQERINKAQQKQTKVLEESAQINIQEGAAYINDLMSTDSLIQKSDSGLCFKILEAGTGQVATLEDTVKVHYKGSRIDGTVFDSSYDRGEPANFPLNGVVAGFGEGLTKIGVGGKIILYIPSNLGYGNTPRGQTIQPGDTLIFECELIEINPES